MKLGLIGLPNTGKTTLFNALTAAGAATASYAFSTKEPNVGVIPVPDARLDALALRYSPKKITPATVTFVDIAGLAQGASRGEGMGNQFLSHIREVDAVVHVVRFFDDPDVVFYADHIDPAADVDTLKTELALADLQTLEKQLERTGKMLKANDPDVKFRHGIMKRAFDCLNDGRELRGENFSPEEMAVLRECFLLTIKPVLYVANIPEDMIGKDSPQLQALGQIAKNENAGMLAISALIESEISVMEPADQEVFLKELGLEESGMARLAQAGYALLNLISFLTAGPKEVRAWPIPRGTKAPRAAGTIHSDLERGFIRAEIVAYDALMQQADYNAAKAAGIVRSEGKEYVMQDGDVTLIRFNV